MNLFCIGKGCKLDPQRVGLFIHWIDSHTIKRQERKVFLFQRTFAHLLAALEFISLCEQHEREDIRHGEYVNRFLFIIFTMGASKSRATLISLYSDIYHIEYGKNIISNSYAIDISLCIDTCHIAYGIAIPASHFPFSGHRSKMRLHPNFTP